MSMDEITTIHAYINAYFDISFIIYIKKDYICTFNQEETTFVRKIQFIDTLILLKIKYVSSYNICILYRYLEQYKKKNNNNK